MDLIICFLCIFHAFCRLLIVFFFLLQDCFFLSSSKSSFSIKIFQEYPCVQTFCKDDTSKQRVKVGVVFGNSRLRCFVTFSLQIVMQRSPLVLKFLRTIEKKYPKTQAVSQNSRWPPSAILENRASPQPRNYLDITSTKQGLKYHAQGNKTVPPVGLEPATFDIESSNLLLSHCAPPKIISYISMCYH